MYDLIAIDPGNHAGVVYFIKSEIVRAELVLDAKQSPRECTDTLVVEVPRIYPHSPADPESILKLAYTAGRLVGNFEAVKIVKVEPRGWKGQRPKKVDNRYTMSLLSVAESKIVKAAAPPSLLDNVIDAAGIGLWKLGRR